MRRVAAGIGTSSVVVAVGAFVAAATLTAAVGSVWARPPGQPRVTVLGSGERLSVLVTAGEARLLIATGDDETGFGNALGRARGPLHRRVDVLLVGGDGAGANVAAAAVDDLGARYVAALGPVSGAAGAVRGVAVLPSPRRIELGREVAVTVGWEEVEEGDGAAEAVWWAVVRRGGSEVAVVSDGRAVPAAGGAVGALVVAAGEPFEALERTPAEMVVAASGAVTGEEMREEAARAAGREVWGARVFPGEVLRLDLVEGGIEVEREGVQRLGEATVEPSPGPAVDGA